jgi:outer membrane usher protein
VRRGSRDYGNSTIDRFGYGIGSSLTPYRENIVSLDIDDLNNDVELKNTSATVIPRRGAVVVSKFETDQENLRLSICYEAIASPCRSRQKSTT